MRLERLGTVPLLNGELTRTVSSDLPGPTPGFFLSPLYVRRLRASVAASGYPARCEPTLQPTVFLDRVGVRAEVVPKEEVLQFWLGVEGANMYEP
jgi:hypothetical protein